MPSGDGVGSTSSPAPVVSCSGLPAACAVGPHRDPPDVEPAAPARGEVHFPPVGRPRGVEIEGRVVRHSRRRARGGVRGEDIGHRLLDAPEDEPRAVGRPARARVHHRLAGIGGELARIQSGRVADPDPPRAGPGRVEREPTAVGRPRRAERIGHEPALRSRPHVHGPDVPALEVPVVEIGRLELAAVGGRAHEGQTAAVGRPGRLDVVPRAARQPALLARRQRPHEQLPVASDLRNVRESRAVGRPRRPFLDPLGGGDRRHPSVEARRHGPGDPALPFATVPEGHGRDHQRRGDGEHRDAGPRPRAGFGGDALERVGELRGRGEALVRQLGQRPGHDRRHHRGRAAERGRGLREMLRGDGLRTGPVEWRLAGQHLVEHAAERVDVTARIHEAFAAGLLGAHVHRRSHREPCR